jgi:hypothetical protein
MSAIGVIRRSGAATILPTLGNVTDIELSVALAELLSLIEKRPFAEPPGTRGLPVV